MMRFACVSYLTPLFNVKFPVGTFIVNIVGSLLIGVLYVLLVEKNNLSPLYRLFFITGFLGGFTTFSSFSLEMVQLSQSGHVVNSIAYAMGSLLLGMLAAFFGIWMAQKVL